MNCYFYFLAYQCSSCINHVSTFCKPDALTSAHMHMPATSCPDKLIVCLSHGALAPCLSHHPSSLGGVLLPGMLFRYKPPSPEPISFIRLSSSGLPYTCPNHCRARFPKTRGNPSAPKPTEIIQLAILKTAYPASSISSQRNYKKGACLQYSFSLCLLIVSSASLSLLFRTPQHVSFPLGNCE